MPTERATVPITWGGAGPSGRGARTINYNGTARKGCRSLAGGDETTDRLFGGNLLGFGLVFRELGLGRAGSFARGAEGRGVDEASGKDARPAGPQGASEGAARAARASLATER